MSKEKVVLAYSGGLDTSVCVKWLQDEKNLDVVCVCGNVGQEVLSIPARQSARRFERNVVGVQRRQRPVDEGRTLVHPTAGVRERPGHPATTRLLTEPMPAIVQVTCWPTPR